MTTVIVGGGLAGLAAAVALTAKGERVTVLESRSFCGGRAYSYQAPVVGDTIDNGQHVMLGCYHATLKYLSLIGARDLLDIQPQLAITFLQDADHVSKLHCPRLPSPLHLLVGILSFCGMGDAWSLFRHRRDLLSDPASHYLDWDQMSCQEWLQRNRISHDGVQKFWEPLIYAVMNDAPARVSAAPFLAALHRIVSGSPEDASLAVSRVGLSDLFVAPALRFLQERGSVVRTGVTVSKISFQDDRIVSLSTVSEENIPVTKIIFAIPPRNLEKLLADVPGT
ncbi:MAG: FAD-dependent oxidoreductase, partial [Sideroxyarcus sp.]|nr:FAD-dependent oxidoreductase [Sideroxyarcus sp.]